MEGHQFNDSAVPDSPAADFYDVLNKTFCPEGYNLTGNGTVCARAPIGGSVLSDGNVLLYIIGLLTFYGCSMLFLLLLFAKSEQEDIELESYYETYIERAELRDGMARGVIRGEKAGRPAQVTGTARGVIRGERAELSDGMARGVIQGETAGRPAQTARRPAEVSGMPPVQPCDFGTSGIKDMVQMNM
ncbi:PREDICTED: uncharacterized protein LOC109477520 [Branchiostoma belcheri]|uniref:Uncharacterized protein LOC109477520 n=1 Tax=Branchiostoma belcheri TaxID=7741 RepID=A0A6P4YYD6_BRABE|nr:PREDICTED: uncharacterized protein LOC109477520 [Branchiostoma belcheri]